MTVENISRSISKKACCRPRRRLNPRPPGLQLDGASNWATEAGLTTFGRIVGSICAEPHDSGAILWLTLRCPSVRTLFQDNSSHNFNQISLKLVGQLDHEQVQRILFCDYRAPNCDRLLVDTLFNNFSDLTLFSDNSFYSFNPNMVDSRTMRWCSARCFEITVHMIEL